MSTTKKDLIQAVSRKTGLTQVDGTIILEALLESIARALINGRRIEIRGFGRFKVKTLPPRMARNPKTGAAVQVPEKTRPKFHASPDLIRKISEFDRPKVLEI